MSLKLEKNIPEREYESSSLIDQDEDAQSISEDLSIPKKNGHKAITSEHTILEPTANLSSSSMQAVVCGAKQLNKLKRFLTTLLQFANDISPEISECVKNLILNLINSGK